MKAKEKFCANQLGNKKLGCGRFYSEHELVKQITSYILCFVTKN